MQALNDFVFWFFGPDGKPTELTIAQICVRGVLIFVAGLAMVRVGDRRSLAQRTAFDAMFIVLLGSMLSRAINGSGPLFKTIAATAALFVVHRSCAYAACRWHPFGKLIKGQPIELVKNGRSDHEAMRSCLVSDHDLDEDLHLDAKTERLGEVELARLERSGRISFIKKAG